MATNTTGRPVRARSATKKTEPPVVQDPPAVELDYRPGKGARFVYSAEAMEKILAEAEKIYKLLPTEFLATATPLAVGTLLVQNGFNQALVETENYGLPYETKPVSLADGSQLRISVVVSVNKRTGLAKVKLDFRSWFVDQG